jgi:hypothetical protein
MENIIDDWLQSVFEKISKDKQNASIHIEELFPQYHFESKKELFTFCVNMLEAISTRAKQQKLPFIYQINVQIELESSSNNIKGLPADKDALIKSIDDKSNPEIVIFCPSKEYWKPVVEMYACPVYFLLGNTNCYWLYQEYRTVDDLKDNEPYHRWLTGSVIFGNLKG